MKFFYQIVTANKPICIRNAVPFLFRLKKPLKYWDGKKVHVFAAGKIMVIQPDKDNGLHTTDPALHELKGKWNGHFNPLNFFSAARAARRTHAAITSQEKIKRVFSKLEQQYHKLDAEIIGWAPSTSQMVIMRIPETMAGATLLQPNWGTNEKQIIDPAKQVFAVVLGEKPDCYVFDIEKLVTWSIKGKSELTIKQMLAQLPILDSSILTPVAPSMLPVQAP